MSINGAAGMVVHVDKPALAKAGDRADLSIRFSQDQRNIILDTCCGGAPESEAMALIAIAEARGLNPILGECYFVKRYDSQSKKDKWSVQASIDSFRIKAEQTGLYAGQDEPEYEYDQKGYVVLARVKVWRKDWTRPAVGVARWEEYVQTTRDGEPTRFWKTMPHNQLAKCAEALAMRKAFPAVLSKVYVTEEMQQADNEAPLSPAYAPDKATPVLPAPDGKTFQKLCDRLDAAETVAEVNTVAVAAGKAHKAGQITDGHMVSLKTAVLKKRDLVATPPPEPTDTEHADEYAHREDM
jgi:phage recombination protein Bet